MAEPSLPALRVAAGGGAAAPTLDGTDIRLDVTEVDANWSSVLAAPGVRLLFPQPLPPMGDALLVASPIAAWSSSCLAFGLGAESGMPGTAPPPLLKTWGTAALLLFPASVVPLGRNGIADCAFLNLSVVASESKCAASDTDCAVLSSLPELPEAPMSRSPG